MHKITRRIITVAATSGAALGLAVATTSAAPQATWTVTPGGAITAHADNPGVVTAGGSTYNCTAADGTGSVKSGSGLSGTGIGQIDTLKFTGCQALGMNITITTSATPYPINVTGVNASNPDWVNGEVVGVKAHVSAFLCSADFTGTVHGHFDNTAGTLVADGTSMDLTASNASCLGQINNGDKAGIKAVIKLNPSQKITLD